MVPNRTKTKAATSEARCRDNIKPGSKSAALATLSVSAPASVVHDHLVHQHIVSFLDVVNTDSRILPDLGCFDHLTIRGHVGNVFTEPVMDRFASARAKHQ